MTSVKCYTHQKPTLLKHHVSCLTRKKYKTFGDQFTINYFCNKESRKTMSRKKEEALSAGVRICETKHQMKRRSPWHDYYAKGTYMLTLVVKDRQPLLGRLEIRNGKPVIELSLLGKTIVEGEVKKITAFYPMVKVWKLCVMPDHIHIIIRVEENMPKGKHLGQVVWGFKVGCTQAMRRLLAPNGKPSGTETTSVPAGSSTGKSLFEPGYNDKILLRDGQLENWKHYLDDNPRRLFIKRQHPDYFTVIHQSHIAGRTCQMVGNRFLLDIPDKMAVIVHRAYSDKEYEDYRKLWLDYGEAGGVLVSAAIAPREKTVMREAMNRGYRIILLRENGFPPLYKPSGESFEACAEGRLLQISPWEYHMERKIVSREQCLQLNRMAEDIATWGFSMVS